MKIGETTYLLYECNCVNCKASEGAKYLNHIEFDWHNDTVLCDDCLQELNRKIVEHLAEKNI